MLEIKDLPTITNRIGYCNKMDLVLTVDVGVVVSRQEIDHPWQDHVWRPVEVFLNPPARGDWRELRRGESFIHYHAATIAMELHRKEAPGYRENLSYDNPSIFVVLRQDDLDDGDWPVEVHMVTASPYDVEAYGDADEIIEAVPMPEPLIALVSEFVDEHYVEEEFKKRKRKRHHRQEDYHFGQEPVVELRARMELAKKRFPTNE